MPTAADGFPKASFDGVQFPVENVKIRGGIRYHVHEYPHAPGGAPEKLGRSLYRVQMTGNFQDRFRGYPKLYPQALDKLRVAFESQKTATLIVPNLGPIDAFCVSHERDFQAKIRSGEKTSFEFLEDQSGEFLLEALTDLSSPTLDTHAADMARQLAQIKAELAAEDAKKLTSLVDAVQGVVNAIGSVRDQAELYGNVLEARLLQVAQMCDTINSLSPLQNPVRFGFIDALHDLHASALAQLEDLNNTRVKLEEFVVPMLMSLQAVSTAIFGDATHTDDLLSLNAVPDAYRVPAGTKIRYYPAA